jgi:hypothetical protein
MVDLFHSGVLDRLDKWAEAAGQLGHRRSQITYSSGWVEFLLFDWDGTHYATGIGSGVDGERALDLAIDSVAASCRCRESDFAERLALESASSTERAATDSERDARGAAE